MKDFLIWGLYNILFAVGYTLMLPKFFLRMWRRGGYRDGFMQRFGVYDDELMDAISAKRRIWVHAVSVGEVFVALHFIDEMQKVFPEYGFILTTTTSTGHAQAKTRLSAGDVLLYFPADLPFIVRRVVRKLNPVAVVLTECELWPNILRCLNGKGVPVFVVNGRISESSFRGYSKVRPFFRRAVALVDLLMVQSHVDERRLLGLGTPAENLIVMGSAKYDTALPDPAGVEIARKIIEDAGMNPDGDLLVAGSTWPGEEVLILEIFVGLQQTNPDLQLILVPRHMERRSEVEEILKKSELPYIKRTDMVEKAEGGTMKAEAGADKSPCVLLADTTGELMHYYAVAAVVFVGKSMGDNFGGQNPIEPAMFGKAVVVGPHMENFPGVMDDFITAEALIQVAGGGELKEKLSALLSDADMRQKYGKRAGSLVAEKSGVVARSIELIRVRMNTRS